MNKNLKTLGQFLAFTAVLFFSGVSTGENEVFTDFLGDCISDGEVSRVINSERLFVQCKQVNKKLEWVEDANSRLE